MEKSQIKPFIARRVAREIHDGDVINLGIGLPTYVADYLPEGVHVTLHSENGMIGTGPTPTAAEAQPLYVTDAGGFPAAVSTGGVFIDSSVSFAIARGGHVDATVLGALQVDARGNLANWLIPGVKVPGMGGAMDLLAGARRVIIAMEHTARGEPKILEQCTLPLTAVNCVDLIVTEMCVIEVRPDGLHMTEYNPEFTVDEIRAATGAQLHISEHLKPMV